MRALTEDDPRQSPFAQAELDHAEVIALPLPVLCELVWVLSRGYRIPSANIVAAIRCLIETSNATVNRPAPEAGLATLDTGGDFADGVIAHEGRWLGGGVFVSFDRDTVARIKAQGDAGRLLA